MATGTRNLWNLFGLRSDKKLMVDNKQKDDSAKQNLAVLSDASDHSKVIWSVGLYEHTAEKHSELKRGRTEAEQAKVDADMKVGQFYVWIAPCTVPTRMERHASGLKASEMMYYEQFFFSIPLPELNEPASTAAGRMRHVEYVARQLKAEGKVVNITSQDQVAPAEDNKVIL